MSINLTINSTNSTKIITISESRAQRFLSGNKEVALYMGLWDKIADFFRAEKKADAMALAWEFLFPVSDDTTTTSDPFKETINVFNRMKAISDHPEAFDLGKVRTSP
ncbi:Salmonella outer protein D [Escherichia coli]|uniref:hypothetical protein n=1 Tax=Escherichia coli TaxID=562 RepID=UPI000DA48B7F|nr:hypothetical protein [Escherichia coli]SQM12140.1 Salmonella outer protein D [Escherichia coli]SQM26812.1 Salmonella outer protein D [Escherichia coli]